MAGGRSQRHVQETRPRDNAANGRGVRALTRPTVTGTTTNGQTLTGTNGTFEGGLARDDTLVITRYWKRGATVVPGQTAATYVLGPSDVGFRMTFGNIAKSRNGSVAKEESTAGAVVA